MTRAIALLGAAAGTHAADQMALATLPLTATLVLGAGPDLLGLVVFAQAVATYFMVGVNYATETYGTRLVSRLKDQPDALRQCPRTHTCG